MMAKPVLPNSLAALDDREPAAKQPIDQFGLARRLPLPALGIAAPPLLPAGGFRGPAFAHLAVERPSLLADGHVRVVHTALARRAAG